VSLDVRADGTTQILSITDYDPQVSVYKPKHRSSTAPTRQDTLTSTAEAFEVVPEKTPPSLSFVIDFAGIGISFINRKLVEVIYLSLNKLCLEYTHSTVAQAVNVSCDTLQIDNQLHDALYPVILQPTPIPKESAALPTIQASLIWLNDEGKSFLQLSLFTLKDQPLEHGVVFVKYCSILLQALTIETDEDLLFSIYDLTQIKGAYWEDNTEELVMPIVSDTVN
jgi:vacuolar protein sorting-associated protein 13A/C